MRKIFLLSPAHSGGKRAELIFNPRAQFPLARRLQRAETVALGEIFSFLSGLYFRGKLTYARAFAMPPKGLHGAYVITSNRGLVPADVATSLADLKSFSRVDIDPGDMRYRRPLLRDARRIAEAHPNLRVVLLGSISTGKYVDVLLEAFGERLHFPREFVGRGDMSRGGLMLRCARNSLELEYGPVVGAVRRGARPPKLQPIRGNRQRREGMGIATVPVAPVGVSPTGLGKRQAASCGGGRMFSTGRRKLRASRPRSPRINSN